jgi:tRNA dimethylallyltransferase
MGTVRSAPPIILLAGPTAAGKTALSIKLAERVGTEIINADSMQVYRHMNIGTAKPGAEERVRVRHHLLDIVDPDEPFNAARYLEFARPVVDDLHNRGSVPIVVGGTGLYMKVLTRGICPGAPGDPLVQHNLMVEAEEKGLPRLYQELLQLDAKLAGKINPNDRQRIIRALEVYRLTGVSLSHWQERHRFQSVLYPSIKIFVFRQREDLYSRIDRRVHLMMDQGFLDEVRDLLSMGYHPGLKPMQSLGYKQLVQHLLGELSFDAAVHLIQRETRRYAKRQMTWFRGDPEFRWFDAAEEDQVIKWTQCRLGE